MKREPIKRVVENVGLDILCIAGHRTEIMDRQCRRRVALNPSRRNEK